MQPPTPIPYLLAAAVLWAVAIAALVRITRAPAAEAYPAARWLRLWRSQPFRCGFVLFMSLLQSFQIWTQWQIARHPSFPGEASPDKVAVSLTLTVLVSVLLSYSMATTGLLIPSKARASSEQPGDR